MRTVSTIEHVWVDKKLKRMKDASLSKLSGHANRQEEIEKLPMAHGWSAEPVDPKEVAEKRNDDDAVSDAKRRYLERKKKKK